LRHKEIHISDRESDRKSKERKGIDRNRQDYISDIENYCIIKIGNLDVKENPTEKKNFCGGNKKKQFLRLLRISVKKNFQDELRK
jgi:hypothetical protein